MKLKIFVFFTLLSGICSISADAQRLTIIIKNIRDIEGNVGAAVYKNEKDFLKTPFATKAVKATPGEATLVFDNLPAGNYGISVLHDTNGNDKMDSDFIGVPKEGFGFSNDAMGAFGPPKFEKAMISFTGKDQTIVITMKYI
jgi:uncharacterized protein (DUF2141 family)